jgi:hypothetical protein
VALKYLLNPAYRGQLSEEWSLIDQFKSLNRRRNSHGRMGSRGGQEKEAALGCAWGRAALNKVGTAGGSSHGPYAAARPRQSRTGLPRG